MCGWWNLLREYQSVVATASVKAYVLVGLVTNFLKENCQAHVHDVFLWP